MLGLRVALKASGGRTRDRTLQPAGPSARAPGAQPGTSTGRSRGRRPRGSTPGITDRTDCSTPGITVACGCPGWGNTVKPHLGPRGRCARATVSPTLRRADKAKASNFASPAARQQATRPQICFACGEPTRLQILLSPAARQQGLKGRGLRRAQVERSGRRPRAASSVAAEARPRAA